MRSDRADRVEMLVSQEKKKQLIDNLKSNIMNYLNHEPVYIFDVRQDVCQNIIQLIIQSDGNTRKIPLSGFMEHFMALVHNRDKTAI